ncbi:MAG: hypothetical protein ACREJC_08310 [Tepidisphaeraceae bacterium]
MSMKQAAAHLPRVIGQPTLIFRVVCVAALASAGCAGGRSGQPASMDNSQQAPISSGNPEQIQVAIMSFADRYATAMADAYDLVQRNSSSLEARTAALKGKLLAGAAAIMNAVDPNPIVGLMDMAVMVTLTRQLTEDPRVAEVFGRRNVDTLLDALKIQETDVWNVAASYLTPDQIKELHELAARWLREHPEQRYVATARLANFPEARQSAAGAPQLLNSVFGMITLDPFEGLNPAVREVAQSRILAERMFYYLQHMPVIVSWQADLLVYQMLSEPQVAQLIQNTSTIAGSTTRFTDDTSRFSDASMRVADSVERFRQQLPDQQAKLVEQLDALISQQRDAVLAQATTQVSAQRDATIKQLNSSVETQQDITAQNLQRVMDRSIDRLYERLRSLVLIAAGSILGALLAYRLVAAMASGRKTRE